MAASGVIFFAYIGFDAISTAAQEAKNPQRDMPIGILASLVICTVLYVIVSTILTGMVSYKELDVAAPVALALDKYPGLHWLGIPVKLGAIAGMTSVMLVMTIAQARIFFAMARDGLLPPFFGRVHPRFRTPSTGTAITGVTAAIIGGLFPVKVLGELVSIGTLAAFVTVCLGVLILRRTRPDLPRPFRAPWPWFTCSRRRHRVWGNDVFPGSRHLVAPGDLDRGRRGRLRGLRLPAQLRAQGRQRRRRRRASGLAPLALGPGAVPRRAARRGAAARAC